MKKISIYCDGGSRGNPGPGAVAFVVLENGKIIYKFSKRIGKTTNNVAEYQAVIEALGWVVSSRSGYKGGGEKWEVSQEVRSEKKEPTSHLSSSPQIHFFLDSQLVVNQLNGRFKIKDAKLRSLIIQTRALEQKVDRKIFYHLISRRQNKIADTLINQSLNAVSR
ncbi:MAG: ribonuclease HI family protein [Patescibacteria group bacterium]